MNSLLPENLIRGKEVSISARGPLPILALAILIFSGSAPALAQTLVDLHDFVQYPRGLGPANLIADQAGNLYGQTSEGGSNGNDAYGYGTIFKLSPSAGGKWTQSVLYNFQGGADGSGVFSSNRLIIDSAGNLYGTTYYGGGYYSNKNWGYGTVFELSPSANGTWNKSVLYSFAGKPDGFGPNGALVFDGAGNLYGTTVSGGAYDSGTVFELAPNGQGGWTETTLYSFANLADGGLPAAGVIFDAAGNLYGTTTQGGDLSCYDGNNFATGCGVAFKLTHNADGTWTESTLHTFIFTDGAVLAQPMTFDAAGNLFGTTEMGPSQNCGNYGCGLVFRLSPGSSGTWNYSLLYAFAGGPDGQSPSSPLVFGNDGTLYGTTSQGGMTTTCNGCGTVFSLEPGSGSLWQEKVIHSFSGVRGAESPAGLIVDQTGNLYGAAGSTVCCGMIFKLTKSLAGGWNSDVLYQFPSGTDGLQPTAGLVADNAGNLYGTTVEGGAHGMGSVFELVKLAGGGWRERVLYSFRGGADGQSPVAGLAFDSAGNLYGTTWLGGNQAGYGTVFELSPASHGAWQESVIHVFQGGSDGVAPRSAVVVDASGNVYGTTLGGGSATCNLGFGCGVVFELSSGSGGWTEKIVYSFQGGADGAFPSSAPVLDEAGNLYGTSGASNLNNGVVFKLSPGSGSWTFSVRHAFSGHADGIGPNGVILDQDSNIYGTTGRGGANQLGIAFLLPNNGSGIEILHAFAGGADGAYPDASLVRDQAGNLYGPTSTVGVVLLRPPGVASFSS